MREIHNLTFVPFFLVFLVFLTQCTGTEEGMAIEEITKEGVASKIEEELSVGAAVSEIIEFCGRNEYHCSDPQYSGVPRRVYGLARVSPSHAITFRIYLDSDGTMLRYEVNDVFTATAF